MTSGTLSLKWVELFMASTQELISFFRDCLQEERSQSGVPNLFAGRVLKRSFLTGFDAVTGSEFESIPLPKKVKQSMSNAAELRKRDTEFLYATLPITGPFETKAIVCPLLLYPIRIIKGELFLALDQVRINPAVFTIFGIPTSAESDLLELVPEGVIGPAIPILLAKELKTHLVDLDISRVDQFPDLLGSGEVKKVSKKKHLSILPASAVIISERSKNVAGLLQELKQVSALPEEKLSMPLQALLGCAGEDLVIKKNKGKPEYIPALLSDAQMALIDSINAAPLTVCQGPPGTGKSFTIAAAATEQVLMGRSVLICCRTNEAANVLHEKLVEMIPNSKMIVRAGRRGHLKKLRSTITELLGSYQTSILGGRPKTTKREISKIVSDVFRYEKWLKREVDEGLKTGKWFQMPSESWWVKMRKWIHLKTLKSSPLLAEVAATFRQLHEARLGKAREFNILMHKVNLLDALDEEKTRKSLNIYLKSLKSRYARDQEKALKTLDPRALLKVCPIWITTTDDLHRVIPLKSELFDLAIIDEATQCDLASVIPVLMRAKRGLIAGDPKQLRHISFLSEVRHSELAKMWNLDSEEVEKYHYRNVSLIDRGLEQVLGSKAYVFLNEHFRSLPELIRFSNNRFYQGKMHLMREPEVMAGDLEALKVFNVHGKRDALGVNREEISKAIDICREVLDASLPMSVGFLSPFRAQVEAFLKLITERLTPHEVELLIKRHQLVAGTGHSFQGAERDHMIVSLVLTNSSPHGAHRFAEREDVFNVAVTRSREKMSVLHSLEPGKLRLGSLLRGFLLQGGDYREAKAGTPSLADLIPTLSAIGWKVVPRATLSGVPVDLLLLNGAKYIAIDLIGTPGAEGSAIPLSKMLLLDRTGVTLVPLRLDEWLHQKNEVIEFLRRLLPEASA